MYFSSIWEALSLRACHLYLCMEVSENYENIQKRNVKILRNRRSTSLPARQRDGDLTRQIRIHLSFEFEIKLDL